MSLTHQPTEAKEVALAGLIVPAIPGQVGMRVLAQLTDAGTRALEMTA